MRRKYVLQISNVTLCEVVIQNPVFQEVDTVIAVTAVLNIRRRRRREEVSLISD